MAGEFVNPEEMLAGVADEEFLTPEEEQELSGLARRYGIRYGRPTGLLVKRFHRNRLIKTLKRSVMTRNQKMLAANVTKLDTETVKRIKEGSVKQKDLSFYIRKEITGQNGVVRIFDDTIDKIEGITNISKGKLAEHINMLLSRFEMGAGTGTKPEDAQYDPIALGTTPAGLVNGEVEVQVGSTTLFKIPVSDLQNPDRKYFGNGPANGVNFENALLVPERTDIRINLYLVGAIPTTNQYFVEFKLKGVGVAPIK